VSAQNVELHRRGIDAFNARNVEAFIELGDPQIEFHSVYAAVGGAVYHGHDGTRRFFRDLEDTWHEIRVEPEAYFDLGEHTLLYYVGHAQGRQSGAEVAGAWAQVCRWRKGSASTGRDTSTERTRSGTWASQRRRSRR
jgi:ketosteroid isomerase-like protein